MKFHEWMTIYSGSKLAGCKEASDGEASWYLWQKTQLQEWENETTFPELMGPEQRRFTGELALSVLRHQVAVSGFEHWWYEEKRPYYKVFPCVTKALTGIKLHASMQGLSIPDRIICIRFSEGNEPQACNTAVITSLLAAVFENELCFSAAIKTPNRKLATCMKAIRLDSIGTIDSVLESMQGINPEGELTESDTLEIAKLGARISFATHLLADDPSIITPDVLSADRDRYESETDEAWKQRAVDRARRRGIVGWNIGADYEVCPHYRRPHFGLRYTGKGGTVPRIVPIKGAVVHRSKLTEVPTGYMLPDGTEVEK